MKNRLLIFLIAVSCLNILNYNYDINLVDMLPKLRADEATLSTLLFEHPKTGFSIILMKGDLISLDTHQGLYEKFIFEYYDSKESEIYISKENNQYRTPLNKVNYIHINPKSAELSALRATALVAGGAALGGSLGAATGCIAGFQVDAHNLGIPGLIAGGTLGAILGASKGLAVDRGISQINKSVKIKLSGKNAWKINSIVVPLN